MNPLVLKTKFSFPDFGYQCSRRAQFILTLQLFPALATLGIGSAQLATVSGAGKPPTIPGLCWWLWEVETIYFINVMGFAVCLKYNPDTIMLTYLSEWIRLQTNRTLSTLEIYKVKIEEFTSRQELLMGMWFLLSNFVLPIQWIQWKKNDCNFCDLPDNISIRSLSAESSKDIETFPGHGLMTIIETFDYSTHLFTEFTLFLQSA